MPHSGSEKHRSVSGDLHQILKTSPSGRRIGSFHTSGIVNAGQRTFYSFAGEDIIVSDETWIIGKLTMGSIARVQGVVIEKVGKVASKITIVG